MLELSVQIVNYKTKDFLKNCIDSVASNCEQAGVSYKILILDNNSGDNLEDLEKDYVGDKVEFFYSQKNGGFGAGQNLLAAKTDSKYILALNPDTTMVEGAIRKLFDFMEARTDVGLCGPRVTDAHFWSHKRYFWPQIFKIKHFFERFFKIKILKKINILEFNPILGVAMFFRRSAFEKVGGFDENLFLYFEDGDICNSLKKAGYKIFFIYDAVVNHIHKQRTIPDEEFSKYFNKSMEYFYKKWPSGDIK